MCNKKFIILIYIIILFSCNEGFLLSNFNSKNIVILNYKNAFKDMDNSEYIGYWTPNNNEIIKVMNVVYELLKNEKSMIRNDDKRIKFIFQNFNKYKVQIFGLINKENHKIIYCNFFMILITLIIIGKKRVLMYVMVVNIIGNLSMI